MNRTTLRLLAIVLAVLVGALLFVESGDDGDLPESGALLFPELRAVANDISRLTITRAGQDPLEIVRQDGAWRLPDRGGYPARTEAIRAVVLAMTEATVVEPKTANPELHARLGVDRPDGELSKGVLIEASAGDQSFDLVFGNVAQGAYRYARIAGDDQSWLIDQNPEIPLDVADWLVTDIVDIDSSSVRSARITHADGEVIAISKGVPEDTNFDVADIPDGRELTYTTVANGIGGALNDLDLDDVRASQPVDQPAVVSVFETFDHTRITATVYPSDDGNWVEFAVESTGDDSTAADEIGARVDGWQYRIADYKASLLTRRWEDILEPLPDEESE